MRRAECLGVEKDLKGWVVRVQKLLSLKLKVKNTGTPHKSIPGVSLIQLMFLIKPNKKHWLSPISG